MAKMGKKGGKVEFKIKRQSMIPKKFLNNGNE
jgi:hypothetical protein